MSGSSPSKPLAVLAPGQFVMQPYSAGTPGAGLAADFNGQVAAAMQGAATFAQGSYASGLTASGTTSANAKPITTQFAHFGTVASGTGAKLPPTPWGTDNTVVVANYGVSGLSVYPPTASGIIGNAASGAAYLQATGTTVMYSWFGGNQFGHTA